MMSGVSVVASQLLNWDLQKKTREKATVAYLQMSMYRTRLVCYMDSELLVSRSMEAREKVVLDLARSGGIEADRGWEPGMDWSDVVEGEELAAGDVDVQCSRVEPAEGDAAVDPAGRGGDDAA
jgi:hypothetical protein